MPMRATTVRFTDALWKLLEREAGGEGVSAAQFVRDATIMRIAYVMGQRGDAGFEEAVGRATAGLSTETQPTGAERRQALLDAAAAVNDPERVEAVAATNLLDRDYAHPATATNWQDALDQDGRSVLLRIGYRF